MFPRTAQGFRHLPAGPSRRERIAASVLTLLLHMLLIGWLLHASPDGAFGNESAGTNGGDALVVEYVEIAQHQHESAKERSENSPATAETASQGTSPTSSPVPAPEPAIALITDGDLPSTNDAASAPADTSQAQAEASAMAAAGAQGNSEDDLAARYRAVLRARIGAMWAQMTGTQLPGNCRLEISQKVGGALVSAKADACDLDEAGQRQLEAAALMAQPLPYTGFESVFVADLNLAM